MSQQVCVKASNTNQFANKVEQITALSEGSLAKLDNPEMVAVAFEATTHVVPGAGSGMATACVVNAPPVWGKQYNSRKTPLLGKLD